MANLLKRTFSHSREARGDASPSPSPSQVSPEMNRENVSNKIAAGMDRWHTTLEDMMHLRSSNQVYKDNYWAQNGFDELRRYVKQGSDFSKELAAILQERVEAENYYSKCLAKLGAKLSKACKESVGSCAEAWKHVALEMEKRSEIHRNYSNSLAEELVKPMKYVTDAQLKLRKKIEGNVDKTTRVLTEWRATEAKSKKQSHAAARENEKLQDATLDMSRISRSSSVGHIPHSILSTARAERLANATSEKDAAKLQVKKRKTEDAVKKTEVEYYNVCVQSERARLEWETSVVKGAGMLESVEEERLAQLKTAADCYLRLTAAVPPQLADTTNTLVGPINNANANVDMRVVRGVRSVPAGASEQLLPDFYCEHTTLAMNRERRKQALMKILQLVKQDIERERKSKQGLEKLSMAIKQTPTFGNDDSQQNVADKLYHVRSMLTYLEAVRYKITSSLNDLDSRPPVKHPLATHIQVVRDKQGLQQSVLKVPPWLQTDYQNEVNKNLQPNYTALTKSVNGGEERERRDSIMSRASSKLRIEHLSFRRITENKSAPATPVLADIPTPPVKAQSVDAPAPPESPLDWGERGAGDGLSNQHDSDFDEFSSQSDSSTDLTDILKTDQTDAQAPTPCIGKCRALYTYEARLNDELTLSPGDIINIHDKQGDGWWSGDINGSFGIFPSSYVEEITTCI
ncbi:nostrin isoform X1 [Amyelois transitella]|uniref:nostrin isoform X1 n=2 Tax=Amyelois transitella TaxID=680683 RepID=UPI00067AFA51|nr:nostrin isoform X1 [Amyelois transitella]